MLDDAQGVIEELFLRLTDNIPIPKYTYDLTDNTQTKTNKLQLKLNNLIPVIREEGIFKTFKNTLRDENRMWPWTWSVIGEDL